MATRYIGSKARLVSQIQRFVGSPSSDGYFVDLFCGTGVVAETAARSGWQVRLNDHLTCAVTLAAARLTSSQEARFRNFGGYRSALERLNSISPKSGFIARQYSPLSAKTAGIERRYFTEHNAGKIDAVRQEIARWRGSSRITAAEERILIADLLLASNRVANIAGTYGCFLKGWLPQAKRPLLLVPRDLLPMTVRKQVFSRDAGEVPVNWEDLVYLDPPYTKRQYAAYYHLLETIAEGDEPVVTGKTGLRPWQHKASDFCYRTRARQALVALITRLPARRILLSYSSEGHVGIKDLRSDLSRVGLLKLHKLREITRYRPNETASAGGSHVMEYLLSIERAAAN